MIFDMTVSEEDEREFAGFLQAKIREYNNRHSAHHRAARQPGAVKPLHVMIKDETGQVIGGLSARTYWDWLEIEDLYLPHDLRGQGTGSSLLHKAETVAAGRGVKHCFLSTFEFQARVFYEKHGYAVVGTLQGYPPGAAYYWMRKDLSQNQGLGG